MKQVQLSKLYEIQNVIICLVSEKLPKLNYTNTLLPKSQNFDAANKKWFTIFL